MKRLIVAILILLVSIGIGIFSLIFVETTCKDAVSNLEEILKNAQTENSKIVNSLSDQTNRNWQEKVFLLNILLGRNITSDIDKSLNKIVYFSEISDFESVILYAEDCKEDLLYIIDSNEPDLSTVF